MEDSAKINLKLCECGCGETVKYNKYKNSRFKRGHQFRVYPCKHNQKGKSNSNWKGGRWKQKNGYIMRYTPEHPFCNNMGCVYEHRLVMEEYLGRYLTKTEIIHHKDGNPQNNDISNLQILSQSEHMKLHRKNI